MIMCATSIIVIVVHVCIKPITYTVRLEPLEVALFFVGFGGNHGCTYIVFD